MDCNRRQMVRSLLLGSGLFPAVVNDLLAAEASPLAPKAPHFQGTAKRVIFIYLSGGLSHVDSFDPKPTLAEYERDGKTADNNRKVLGSPWAARPRGQSGIEVTDLFPGIAEIHHRGDDLLHRVLSEITEDLTEAVRQFGRHVMFFQCDFSDHRERLPVVSRSYLYRMEV